MSTIYDDPNYKNYIDEEIEYIRNQFKIRNITEEEFLKFFYSIYIWRNGRYYHRDKYDSLIGYENYSDKNTMSKIKKDRNLINNEVSKYFSDNFYKIRSSDTPEMKVNLLDKETRKKL